MSITQYRKMHLDRILMKWMEPIIRSEMKAKMHILEKAMALLRGAHRSVMDGGRNLGLRVMGSKGKLDLRLTT